MTPDDVIIPIITLIVVLAIVLGIDLAIRSRGKQR